MASTNTLCLLLAAGPAGGCAEVAGGLEPPCPQQRQWVPASSFVPSGGSSDFYPGAALTGRRLHVILWDTLRSIDLETGAATEVTPSRPGVSVDLLDAADDWTLTQESRRSGAILVLRSATATQALPRSANHIPLGSRYLSPTFGAVYRSPWGLSQHRFDNTSEVHPLPTGAESGGADAGEQLVAIGLVGSGSGQVLAFDGERLRDLAPTSPGLGWVRAVGEFVYWQDQGALLRRGPSGPTVMVDPCHQNLVRVGEENLAVVCLELRVYRGDQRVWSKEVEGQVMGLGVSADHVAWLESDPWSGEGPRLGTLYIARLGTDVVVPVHRLRLSSERSSPEHFVGISDTHVAWADRADRVGYLALPPEQVLECGADVTLPPDSTLLD